MNKLILKSLYFLSAIIIFIPSVKAENEIKEIQTPTEEMQKPYKVIAERNTDDERATEAFNLVNSAYRGEYEQQGIPGYSQLILDYNIGEVTPKRLIEAAVEKGDLAPEALNDVGYINAVELQLEILKSN